MARTALTDSQCWLILTSPDTVPDDVLAATIGATASAVHAARWRFRRHGWTVWVSYGVCPLCTRPFTRQGHHASRRRYHDACRPLVLKQLGALHAQARWERFTPAQQQTLLDRAHRHTRDRQAETRVTDSRRMCRWSAAEDDAIRDPAAPPDHDLAVQLGRTLYAIRGRRAWLRRRDGMTEPPGATTPSG